VVRNRQMATIMNKRRTNLPLSKNSAPDANTTGTTSARDLAGEIERIRF
jgi:hypothetical protein